MEGLRNCPACGHEPVPEIIVSPTTGQRWYTLRCPNLDCRWRPHTKKHNTKQDCLAAWDAVCERLERKVARHD